MAGRESKQGFRLRERGDGDTQEFVLHRGENRVGSVPGSEVTLRESGVSRHHALIRWVGDQVVVEDLGSRNGTFLNGRAVTSAALRPGDIVSFGSVELVLETADPAESEVALPCPADSSHSAAPPAEDPRKTTALTAESVPARWLGVLADCARIVSEGRDSGTHIALEAAVTGVGARGAALLEWRAREDLNVIEVAGAFGPPGVFARFQKHLAALQLGPAAVGPGVEVDLLPGNPPLAAAAGMVNSIAARALVLSGDFPHRPACAELLAALFRVIQGEPTGAAAPSDSPPSKQLPELVLPPGFVAGRSAACLDVQRQLRHLLHGSLPVLITGETGVGKEHIARILHASSDRRRGPFVAVNCAAIPSELMEAELFGIEKGVATGVMQREGKFRLAHGGVLFLDEIGDMPAHLQSKVLRALQDQLIWPVGGRQATPVDVRVVSSTNRDLAQSMRDGSFRPDLYYRIAGYVLRMPSLRERKDDIPLLAGQFMERFAREAGKSIRGISAKALEALSEAPWPGNVRELENEVRRLVYVCPDGQPITSAMLSPAVISAPGPLPSRPSEPAAAGLAGEVEEAERRAIATALAEARGNRSRAARLLGISRNGLALKMKRLGMLDGPAPAPGAGTFPI